MIPKASILRRVEFEDLRPTTVEKDYVLGWILYGISQHVQAREWVFKGGTSLKKCFFNTYRFSEDLDFTIPAELPYTNVSLSRTLREITEWVESESGIGFPNNGISSELGRPTHTSTAGSPESLRESLSWWLESSRPTAHAGPIPGKQGERVAARVTFARSAVSHRLAIASPSLERIIYAARNRLCIKITYKGVSRTAEPYSLRYPQTGNTLLYVWEHDRGGVHSNRIKAYNVSKIEGVDLTSLAYTPRFVVEL